MRSSQRARLDEANLQPKWFNSPVTFHKETLPAIRKYMPIFERRCFALSQTHNDRSRLNERLDMIVRRPFGDDNTFVPIGVVSKEYALVQHEAVLDVAMQALNDAKIDHKDMKAELTITEYGERMALSIYLPDKYGFDPGDGHPMALRIEFLNSVDGSTRFRALLGWFRFVCSNGLIIGVTRSDVRLRHSRDVALEDISMMLHKGLNESETEKKNFENWRKKTTTLDKLAPWIDSKLREKWGFKAAARTFHISKSGFDGEIDGPYKGSTPTTIQMIKARHVPGSHEKCQNLFDLSQILAWLAKERRDVQEQLEWREQIPELLVPLLD